LDYFDGGTRTELIFNVLLFSDFGRWEQPMLKRLFEILKEIVEVKQQQKNRILLCYNPVMTIALAAQFLD
jgi:hypothetical protein